MEVELCEYYDVDDNYKPVCHKKHTPTLKCHSKRDCPNYKPSEAYPLEVRNERN